MKIYEKLMNMTVKEFLVELITLIIAIIFFCHLFFGTTSVSGIIHEIKQIAKEFTSTDLKASNTSLKINWKTGEEEK